MTFLQKFGAMIQVWYFLLAIFSLALGIIFGFQIMIVLAMLFLGVSILGSCLDYCARREMVEREVEVQRMIEQCKKEGLFDKDLDIFKKDK